MAHFSYDEAFRLIEDPYSCFTVVTSQQHIALPPSFIGKVKTGVKELLDNELKLYSDRLEGVVIAYSNIRLATHHGQIINEYPSIHLNITADFILFKPTVGSKLKAVVNKIGKDHIGCLVHGCFNASINKRGLQVTDINKFSIGQEIVLSVFKLVSQNGVLSIKADFVDESLQETDESNRKDSSRELLENQDDGSEDEEGVKEKKKNKKKKKKRQKDSEHYVNNLEETDVTDNSHVCDSIKKKKKHKKVKHRNSDTNEKLDMGIVSNVSLAMDDPCEVLGEGAPLNGRIEGLVTCDHDVPIKSEKKKKKRRSKRDEVPCGDGIGLETDWSGSHSVRSDLVKVEPVESSAGEVGNGEKQNSKNRGLALVKWSDSSRSVKESENGNKLNHTPLLEKKAKKRSHGSSGFSGNEEVSETRVPVKKMRLVGGTDADVQCSKSKKHKLPRATSHLVNEHS